MNFVVHVYFEVGYSIKRTQQEFKVVLSILKKYWYYVLHYILIKDNRYPHHIGPKILIRKYQFLVSFFLNVEDWYHENGQLFCQYKIIFSQMYNF